MNSIKDATENPLDRERLSNIKETINSLRESKDFKDAFLMYIHKEGVKDLKDAFYKFSSMNLEDIIRIF